MITCLISFIVLFQDDPKKLIGEYNYSIPDTPYGDYFGKLILRKPADLWQGEMINEEGIRSPLRGIKVQENRVSFKADIEDTNDSYFELEVSGDSLRGSIVVKGDDFNYVLKAKKISTGN